MLLASVFSCQRQAGPEFDAAAAQASAARAAAVALADCQGRPGPDGPGQAELQFAPGGVASAVRVTPEELGRSARGACIERVFRFEAAAPPFHGPASSVLQPLAALPLRPPDSAYPRVSAPTTHRAGRFDSAAAGLALARAARQVTAQCRMPGGPSGTGRIRLTFASDGTVQSAQVLSNAFRDTPAGECVRKTFEGVTVPPFSGETSPLQKEFFLGDGPAPAPSHDYEAAAEALAKNPPPFDASAAAHALKDAAAAAAGCPASDAWGWGEAQVEFLSYGFVDGVTLLTERFQQGVTGSCVANAFRRARVPVFSGSSPTLVQAFQVQPARPFDEAKAAEALRTAAESASLCTSPKSLRGPLDVAVRFGSDGHVSRVVLLTEVFAGSPAGSCVGMVFRRALVPPFDGPAPPLLQHVELPPAERG